MRKLINFYLFLLDMVLSVSNAIDDIIDKIEEKQLKLLYNEFNDVINIISEFVVRKKLILYGGLVINLSLPKKHRFYKDYTINDIDCYSTSPVKDSIELAKIIKKNNYKYIKIKKAKHDGTYKIYVYGKQIFDITKISNIKYKKLLSYSNKTISSLKHYKDKFKIIPLEYMKQNLYFELARPDQSGWRWEKIYKRLNILNMVYPTPKINLKKKCICDHNEHKSIITKLLNYVKYKKYPIIDSYPLRLYNKDVKTCYKINTDSLYITILSNEYNKTKEDIFKLLKTNLAKDLYDISIYHEDANDYNTHPYFEIAVINNKSKVKFNLVKIILNKDECFSTNVKDGFVTGSVDTNVYFLYSEYIKNHIYLNNHQKAKENLYYINLYEQYIKKIIKNDVKKRLKSDCYGKIDEEEFIKRVWKQKLTIKYFS